VKRAKFSEELMDYDLQQTGRKFCEAAQTFRETDGSEDAMISNLWRVKKGIMP
jgi:hypothetical protein